MNLKVKLLIGQAVMIGSLQMLPIGKPSNPQTPPEHRFDRHLHMDAKVAGLLQRACLDCHSNDTKWPWYSRIAPMSWMIVRDVERGRKVMNLSEWAEKSGRRPELGASALLSACSTAKAGRMPRFPYIIFHPEARLSPEDMDMLCKWTSSEARRLMQEKRQRADALQASNVVR